MLLSCVPPSPAQVWESMSKRTLSLSLSLSFSSFSRDSDFGSRKPRCGCSSKRSESPSLVQEPRAYVGPICPTEHCTPYYLTFLLILFGAFGQATDPTTTQQLWSPLAHQGNPQRALPSPGTASKFTATCFLKTTPPRNRKSHQLHPCLCFSPPLPWAFFLWQGAGSPAVAGAPDAPRIPALHAMALIGKDQQKPGRTETLNSSLASAHCR